MPLMCHRHEAASVSDQVDRITLLRLPRAPGLNLGQTIRIEDRNQAMCVS